MRYYFLDTRFKLNIYDTFMNAVFPSNLRLVSKGIKTLIYFGLLFVSFGLVSASSGYLFSIFWSCNFLLFSTLSWRRALSYRNQSFNFQNKSMDWFLFDRNLRPVIILTILKFYWCWNQSNTFQKIWMNSYNCWSLSFFLQNCWKVIFFQITFKEEFDEVYNLNKQRIICGLMGLWNTKLMAE